MVISQTSSVTRTSAKRVGARFSANFYKGGELTMAQKYRLVKTDSAGSQYSPSNLNSSTNNTAHASRVPSGDEPSYQLTKSQRKLRFWRTFSIVLFAAAVAVAMLVWMHSVSGSLSHIRHGLVQQSQANAQQHHQLSQIQSSLQGIQHQLTALGHQMQTYFVKLWTAINHSK